jgi:hypothetical protein
MIGVGVRITSEVPLFGRRLVCGTHQISLWREQSVVDRRRRRSTASLSTAVTMRKRRDLAAITAPHRQNTSTAVGQRRDLRKPDLILVEDDTHWLIETESSDTDSKVRSSIRQIDLTASAFGRSNGDRNSIVRASQSFQRAVGSSLRLIRAIDLTRRTNIEGHRVPLRADLNVAHHPRLTGCLARATASK